MMFITIAIKTAKHQILKVTRISDNQNQQMQRDL